MKSWLWRQFLVFLIIVSIFIWVPHIVAIFAIPFCAVTTIGYHIFTGISPGASFLSSLVTMYMVMHGFFLWINRRLGY